MKNIDRFKQAQEKLGFDVHKSIDILSHAQLLVEDEQNEDQVFGKAIELSYTFYGGNKN